MSKRQKRKGSDGGDNPYKVTVGDIVVYDGNYKKFAQREYNQFVKASAHKECVAFFGKPVEFTVDGKRESYHEGHSQTEGKSREEIAGILTEHRNKYSTSCLCGGEDVNNDPPVVTDPDIEVRRRCISCGREWIETYSFELASPVDETD